MERSVSDLKERIRVGRATIPAHKVIRESCHEGWCGANYSNSGLRDYGCGTGGLPCINNI